jgi:hypothetical protein
MSVFVVNLNSAAQGQLDLDPSTDTVATYGNLGTAFTVSNQRQIWVAGPNRSYRLLKDGETFTDCNYWKQFTVDGGCAEERAFLEFAYLGDDGTIWSDVPSENTYGIGGSGTADSSADTTDDGTADSTLINFMTRYGAPAKFLQVQNTGGTNALVGTLNGNTDLTFTLIANATQTFNVGDLAVTKLSLVSTSGTTFSWIASIRTQPTS